MEQLLTKKDLCKLWQLPKRTLDFWVSAGKIPFVRIGPKSIRFEKDRIEKWLKERENMPAAVSGSSKNQEVDNASG